MAAEPLRLCESLRSIRFVTSLREVPFDCEAELFEREVADFDREVVEPCDAEAPRFPAADAAVPPATAPARPDPLGWSIICEPSRMPLLALVVP